MEASPFPQHNIYLVMNQLALKMHLYNADVVKKFIFRYLSLPLNDGFCNIFMDITNKDIPNKLSS
jgi:hypothetical protein